uniref:Ubiquitin-fold modifier-conjugating enzyme 1 n=1 Tax=Seriola lalandi dorsalis TaxID=1841481 RepID=A0A3B4WDN6_SERLL
MADEATRRAVSQIPLLKTQAGPRDRTLWPQRLKEEYQALIQFVEQNKAADNDWFRLESNADGTRWTGTCWFIHELLRYEFRRRLPVPAPHWDTPGGAIIRSNVVKCFARNANFQLKKLRPAEREPGEDVSDEKHRKLY